MDGHRAGPLHPRVRPDQGLITRVLQEFPELDWEEVDLTEFPELAARFGILSVPAVVIGGKLVFTGVPKEAALREKVKALIERR